MSTSATKKSYFWDAAHSHVSVLWLFTFSSHLSRYAVRTIPPFNLFLLIRNAVEVGRKKREAISEVWRSTSKRKTVLISFYRVREQRRLFYALCRSTRIIITFPNDVENIIFSISPSSKTLNFPKANRYNSLFSLNFRWLLRPWRSGRCGRHHPTGGQNRFLISENFPVHRVHRLIFSSLLTLWPQLRRFAGLNGYRVRYALVTF